MLVVRAGSEALDGLEVKLDAFATDGEFSLLELRLPPGEGAPAHRHTKEHEAIVILDGELTVEAGERRETLKEGDTVFFPCGTGHLFVNDGDTPARALVVTAPAGLEELFRSVASGTEISAAARQAGVEFDLRPAMEAGRPGSSQRSV